MNDTISEPKKKPGVGAHRATTIRSHTRRDLHPASPLTVGGERVSAATIKVKHSDSVSPGTGSHFLHPAAEVPDPGRVGAGPEGSTQEIPEGTAEMKRGILRR